MSFQNNGRPRPQFGRQGAGQRTGLYPAPQPQPTPQPMQGGGAFQGRYPGWGAAPQPGVGLQYDNRDPNNGAGRMPQPGQFNAYGGGMAGQAVNSMQAGGMPGQAVNSMQAGGAPSMAMGQTMPPNAMQMGAPGMTGMDQLRKLLGAYGGVGQGGGMANAMAQGGGMAAQQPGGFGQGGGNIQQGGGNIQQLLQMLQGR